MKSFSEMMLLLFAAIWWLSVADADNGPGGATFTLLQSWNGVDPASFVDLNADRRTDTVVAVQGGSSTPHLEALMEPNAWVARDSHGSQAPVLQALTSDLPRQGVKIRNVVAADFTGNSIVDLLVLTSDKPEGPFEAYIYRGTTKERKFENPILIGTFRAQPLVCDINADMIADVYGETVDDARLLVIGGSVFTNFTAKPPKPWSNQSFAAYAPLLSDSVRSVIVLTDSNQLEVTQPKITAGTTTLQLHPPKFIDLPSVKIFGNPVFGDFDMDGSIDILVAGCKDTDCTQSVIFTYSPSEQKWSEVPVEWTPVGASSSDGSWNLAPAESFDSLSLSPIIGPSVGDSDLDGYPDLAVGLLHRSKSGKKSRVPVILRNTYKQQQPPALAFQAYSLPGVAPNSKADESLRQLAFFDQNEDGMLDLFVSYQTQDQVNTYLFMQDLPSERYFLKVMLTNGLCGSPSSCPANRIPYGLPGYGYRTSYSTSGESGGQIKATSVFVTSSCCGSLQLPYTIFGFGDFANYIQQVPVSVPSVSSTPREHTLTFIVPKAQVVVIPYPPDRPQDWQSKLFLEPLYNMKVIYVAITLICTCVLLIIIISVLQYLEVRADRQEQLQESQRFHFDAM
ncbi:T-cell immunomodulatory protein [Sparganum proliferum]